MPSMAYKYVAGRLFLVVPDSDIGEGDWYKDVVLVCNAFRDAYLSREPTGDYLVVNDPEGARVEMSGRHPTAAAAWRDAAARIEN